MVLAIVGHLKCFDCLVQPCGGGAIEACCLICLVCDSGMWAAIRPPGNTRVLSNTLCRRFPEEFGKDVPRVFHFVGGRCHVMVSTWRKTSS